MNTKSLIKRKKGYRKVPRCTKCLCGADMFRDNGYVSGWRCENE